MSRATSGGVTTAFRLPPSIAARVDVFARSLEGREPGREVTRSEAIRILITRGLDAEVENACKVPFSTVSGAKP
jgi:hypothetical protein